MAVPVSAAILKLFHALPIFVGLTDPELGAIAQLSNQKLYPAGVTIFNDGDPGIEAYVVVRGAIDIILPGQTKPLVQLGTGQIFGELAFLDGQPRTAKAIATEPTILLAIPRDSFDGLCTMEPRLGMVVMHNIALDLSAKLRGANQRMTT
jgi:SulP family sulfate permease